MVIPLGTLPPADDRSVDESTDVTIALMVAARGGSGALARQQQEPFASQTRRLQTMPGVGPIVASTAIAVFSNPERFPDAKHAASYAGLVPSTYQSGDRDAHGRITKRGS